MKIYISSDLAEIIFRDAKERKEVEACGLLVGSFYKEAIVEKVFPMRNLASSPPV